MIQRIGEPVRSDIRYRPRPGAYAILHREGQVLLTHQAYPVPEVQLPGGGIDPGEPILPALHREVMEETGWHVAGLRRLGAFRRFTYMPEYDSWAEKICHVYSGRPTMRISDPIETAHTPLWTPADIAAKVLDDEGGRMFIQRFFG